MKNFIISRQLIDQIIAHARRNAPHEVCGMIGGQGLTAERIYAVANPDASAFTYTIDPKEAFSVIRKMRSDNVEFIGCYHSHPATEAYPSPTDKNKAGDSELIYVIVSLRDDKNPALRAFKINQDKVEELEVSVG